MLTDARQLARKYSYVLSTNHNLIIKRYRNDQAIGDDIYNILFTMMNDMEQVKTKDRMFNVKLNTLTYPFALEIAKILTGRVDVKSDMVIPTTLTNNITLSTSKDINTIVNELYDDRLSNTSYDTTDDSKCGLTFIGAINMLCVSCSQQRLSSQDQPALLSNSSLSYGNHPLKNKTTE